MNYAIVRFSDHGPGVPPEARSKIFERFYTADPSRARQKGGTGLGMAIAQSVVKAHHGFICASGSEANGTDPDGGAADRPGRTQAAADYGERESKNEKRIANQRNNALFPSGKQTLSARKDGCGPPLALNCIFGLKMGEWFYLFA